jgi:uncharacterized protein
METPIGRVLKPHRGRLAFTMALSSIIVGCDLAIVAIGQGNASLRYAFVGIVVVLFGILAFVAHDRAAFGLRFTPVQGWVYWIKTTVWLGLTMGAILGPFAVIVFGILRYPMPESCHYVTHESQVLPLFVGMCVAAPLLEEPIFRLAICPPVTASLGPIAAIAISGTTFGGLHILGGTLGPDNLIAGFVLAWAFLKSGSLTVPIALHSLGNLFVVRYHTAYFYFHTWS